jgi:alanyl-tRNA synthetase
MDDMNELYYQIPYVREFDAVVTGCAESKKGYEITLDRTAFYPEGGGQLSDTGFINDTAVTDTRRRNDVIYHFTNQPFQPGTKVHCRIDWQKRTDHMQAHSGEHIVSGLMYRHYGFNNVGFHMAPDRVTVDFDGVITEEQLGELEREANAVIWADVPVAVSFPSPEELKTLDYRSKKELSGKVRIVTFPGTDVCACCGTHVARTGEIGLIKFISMTHYKGGVRIEMLCGRLALEDYIVKDRQQRELARNFSTKPYELAGAVKQYIEESEAKDVRINETARKYLELRAAQFPAGGGLVTDFEEGFRPAEVRKFCDSLVTGGRAKTAAVFVPAENGGRKGWSYVICSREQNMREAAKTLNSRLNGRGGGDPTLIQGTFFASREDIEKVLAELLG